MPRKDEGLTKQFRGTKIDISKMMSEQWSNQGTEKFHFGLPQKKDLWVKGVVPTIKSCHPIWLFVLMQLTNNQTVELVETAVHHVFNDGSYDEMHAEFCRPDHDKAIKYIEAVCKD